MPPLPVALQIRRQQKDHTVLIEDYRSKRQQQRPPSNAPAAALPQKAAPLQSAVHNVPPAWSPLMGRVLASQMPPALPTSAGVSVAAPPAAGFASAVSGPAAGRGGVSPCDVSAPAPQVTGWESNKTLKRLLPNVRHDDVDGELAIPSAPPVQI